MGTPNEDDGPTPASKIDPGGKKNKKEEDTPNEDDEPTPASKIDPGGKKKKKKVDTPNERMYVIRSNKKNEDMPSAPFNTDLRDGQPSPQWLFSDGNTMEEGMPPVGSFDDDFWMEEEGVGQPGGVGGGGYDDYFVESPGVRGDPNIGFPILINSESVHPPPHVGEYDNNYDNNNNGRDAGIFGGDYVPGNNRDWRLNGEELEADDYYYY